MGHMVHRDSSAFQFDRDEIASILAYFIDWTVNRWRRYRSSHHHTSWLHPSSLWQNRLVGLVVRHPPSERKIRGSNPACAGIFSGSSHTSDSKIGTPVATLPGTWRYRVRAGTGRPGVSIRWLGEVESWICSFCLSVAARKVVWADRPWDTLVCCWDVKQPTNKQTSGKPGQHWLNALETTTLTPKHWKRWGSRPSTHHTSFIHHPSGTSGHHYLNALEAIILTLKHWKRLGGGELVGGMGGGNPHVQIKSPPHQLASSIIPLAIGHHWLNALEAITLTTERGGGDPPVQVTTIPASFIHHPSGNRTSLTECTWSNNINNWKRWGWPACTSHHHTS